MRDASMREEVRGLLDEQIAYYRARAPEYDEWCERRGMFDLGPEPNARWEAEVAEVEAALLSLGPFGRVLELACGTGWWTQRLHATATSIVCVDASDEAMGIAAAKAPGARFIRADIFEWEPEETYDFVSFSFWLSHVPDALFDAFWDKVGRALAPGGRAFFIDNLNRPVPGADGVTAFLATDDRPDGVVERTLSDGRTFRAVKIYHEPDALTSRLRGLGWQASVSATDTFFYWGSATRG